MNSREMIAAVFGGALTSQATCDLVEVGEKVVLVIKYPKSLDGASRQVLLANSKLACKKLSEELGIKVSYLCVADCLGIELKTVGEDK